MKKIPIIVVILLNLITTFNSYSSTDDPTMLPTMLKIKDHQLMRPIIESFKRDPHYLLEFHSPDPIVQAFLNNIKTIAATELTKEYADNFKRMERTQRQSVFERMIILGISPKTLQAYLGPNQTRKARITVIQDIDTQNIAGTLTDKDLEQLIREADALGATEKEYRTYMTKSKALEDTTKKTSSRNVLLEGKNNLYLQMMDTKDPNKFEQLLEQYEQLDTKLRNH